MHLFFMFDEYSDKCKPAEVWQQVRIQMDAVRDPAKPRPEGEWVGGEFTRQYAYLPPPLPNSITTTFAKPSH